LADIGRFSAYLLVLQTLARRIARSEHDAEDAVQDVWVECLTRTHAEILHPSSYLRVAVKHAAQRRAERERNRARREWEVARPESLMRFSLALPAGGHVVEVQTTAGLEGRLAFDPATLKSRTRHIVRLTSR
jgi:DNA-directed RNA polymerase specialized sigma24 family protein